MTVTGARLIAVVLGPMAWLVLRGGRAIGRAFSQDERFTPGQSEPPRPR